MTNKRKCEIAAARLSARLGVKVRVSRDASTDRLVFTVGPFEADDRIEVVRVPSDQIDGCSSGAKVFDLVLAQLVR